jgi:hypothetical protein
MKEDATIKSATLRVRNDKVTFSSSDDKAVGKAVCFFAFHDLIFHRLCVIPVHTLL